MLENENIFASLALLFKDKALYKIPKQFQKEILVFGNVADEFFTFENSLPMREEESELLKNIFAGVDNKILQEKNRKLSELKYLSFTSDFKSLIKEKKINWVISFGEASALLGITLWNEHYKVYENEAVKWLKSHSLQKVSQDKNKKIALWRALGQLFSA